MRKHFNFIILLLLFFGWGFVTCLNDLLTPRLKLVFTLTQYEANFVAFSFFTAYFIGSLVYVICSQCGIRFFINLGYKGLIVLGLILSGLGCLIFVPAAIIKSYPVFLAGLFLVGFGFTFLQISANPLVLISGEEKTAASRLNLAQGFNSLATAVAPLIGVYVFYNLLNIDVNTGNLKYPYIFLFLFFTALAILIVKFLKTNETHTFSQESGKLYALNHSNLLFGAIAIFFYVGSEVSIGTNLVSYLKSPSTVGLTTAFAGKLLAFYWGGAMIGRFLGGVALSSMSSLKKLVLMIIIACVLTLLILLTANMFSMDMRFYVAYLTIAIVLFMLCKDSRANVVIFTIVNIINLIIGINYHSSWFAVWAVLSIGIFNSIMWSNIFDLALDGLGKYKEQGSSFLIMMVFGGAIVPIVQGRVADLSNIVTSFAIPIVGYVYILGYALFYKKKQLNLPDVH